MMVLGENKYEKMDRVIARCMYAFFFWRVQGENNNR